jgi:hypothetical protein
VPPPLPPQDGTAAGSEPTAGAHADEASPPPRTPGRARSRPVRPIDVTLKSEPYGALAEVDGRPIGTTPTLWAGESDGQAHEFTFSLAGFAKAHYRFVPITSGVLHATLLPIVQEPQSGLEPLIAPKLAPGASAAPPPPSPPSSSSDVAPAVPPSAPPAPAPAAPPSTAAPATLPPTVTPAPPTVVPPATAPSTSPPLATPPATMAPAPPARAP